MNVRLPIEPFAVGVEEDRTFQPFADCRVDGPGDDRAQPARHRRPRLATVVEVAGEALDVDAADLEQVVVVAGSPDHNAASAPDR